MYSMYFLLPLLGSKIANSSFACQIYVEDLILNKKLHKSRNMILNILKNNARLLAYPVYVYSAINRAYRRNNDKYESDCIKS